MLGKGMGPKNYDAFVRAKQLLGMGYPVKYVAEQVGVHRNSVSQWGKILGYSAATGDQRASRRVTEILRKVRRLSKFERRAFFALLKEVPR